MRWLSFEELAEEVRTHDRLYVIADAGIFFPHQHDNELIWNLKSWVEVSIIIPPDVKAEGERLATEAVRKLEQTQDIIYLRDPPDFYTWEFRFGAYANGKSGRVFRSFRIQGKRVWKKIVAGSKADHQIVQLALAISDVTINAHEEKLLVFSNDGHIRRNIIVTSALENKRIPTLTPADIQQRLFRTVLPLQSHFRRF